MIKDINIQELSSYRTIYTMDKQKGAIAIEGKDGKDNFIIYLPIKMIMEIICGITTEYLHPEE